MLTQRPKHTPKMNAKNERIKRDYFIYLREAQRRNGASVDAAAKALSRFEESTGYKDFARFHRQQAVAFKSKLTTQKAQATGKPLSVATLNSTMNALRAFFIWLADRPGYKSKICYADADYFNLPEKDVRAATAKRDKPAATLEQMHHALSLMPADTDIEKRNRALFAFAMLTGCRDGALVTLRLKHIDLAAGRVDLDAREVATKFSKSFATWFFPVGGEALAIFTEWVEHLRGALLWGDDDPLFPATHIAVGPHGGFMAQGLTRQPWSTSAPVRTIFQDAYAAAGLPYFPPHRTRNTLAHFGLDVCKTPKDLWAWSQNLGHDHVMTTLKNYGKMTGQEQATTIKRLGVKGGGGGHDALAADLAAFLQSRGVGIGGGGAA